MTNLLSKENRDQLKWMNEPDIWTYIDAGGIRIQAQSGADFFNDPAGNHIKKSAPFLYTTVAESFELIAQIDVEMISQYDSGCLMLMEDELNWAKLCFEYNGEVPTIVSVVTRDGWSDDCNSEEVRVTKPYFKISKVKNCVSFFYSEDGVAWKLIRYFGMATTENSKAGIVAQSPIGSGNTVKFTDVVLADPDVETRF